MGMFSELKKIEEQKIEQKNKSVTAVPPSDSPTPPPQKKPQKTVRKQINTKEENKTSNIILKNDISLV